MKDVAFTVSQMNEYVRITLASDPVLHGVALIGEISNFKRYSSGHWYFTLKDEEAAINCVMFRQYNLSMSFVPENGEKVRLFGSVSLYAKTGSYQFYSESMVREGTGELYLRFERLKNKLMGEGLFDESRKKALPSFPKGIGIVTSRTGAVVHDIARVTWRRFPGMPLYLYSVKVQGEGAAEEIANGLYQLDRLDTIDIIIVGRGGGSMEDLWPFNEEVVARAIADCRKPVVSAVGHETDFSISDFVADVRAATPSHAAELIVPLKSSITEDIFQLQNAMENALTYQLHQHKNQLNLLAERLKTLSPENRYTRMMTSVHDLEHRISIGYRNALHRKQMQLETLLRQITLASPRQTLQRGYAFVTCNGVLVKDAAMLELGQTAQVCFAKGRADMAVLQVYPEQTAKEED